MFTHEDTLSRVHPRLVALIEHERRVSGCVMTAVKNVSRRLGVSQSWIRRITGRYGDVKIQAHQFFNVLREHIRVRRAERAQKRVAKRARILSAENLSAP